MEAFLQVSIFGMSIATILSKLLLIAVVVLITTIIDKIVTRFVTRVLEAGNVPSASILINICRGLIWLLAFMVLMRPIFGIQPTAFIAALGASSLLISFGMQDTIANLVAGLVLMLGHVVRPGDYVACGDVEGEVEDITLRNTVVVTSDGSRQIIPNAVLNKTPLTHLTNAAQTICKFDIVVSAKADLDQVSKDIEGTAHDVIGSDLAEAKDSPSVEVYFKDITAEGILADISLQLKTDVSPNTVRDKMIRNIVKYDWVG